jgi:hypothetical protein
MKLNGEARSLNRSVFTRDKPNGGPPPDWIGKARNASRHRGSGQEPCTGEAGSQEQVRSRAGNTTRAVKGRGRRGRRRSFSRREKENPRKEEAQEGIERAVV